MLRVDDLTYEYDGVKYHYNLELDRSQIVAVMGGSGSGKSTLLDLMCGFLDPISGKVILDAKDISKLPVQDRGISILFQKDNLFEHLSIKKNLELSGAKGGFLSILKDVGLEGFEDKQASDLSGGEQQRVALARTLLKKSDILLLDEPFSALDQTNRHQMLDLIKKITVDKKLHTIFITHNQEDADMIADKIYYMRDSRLSESR